MPIKKYDFDTILTTLQNTLKQKDGWKDIYTSSTGEMLLELIAAGTEYLGYYIERRVQELYMNTAQISSSILHLAALLGYVTRRKTAAIGTAEIDLTNSGIPNGDSVTVVIPKGHTFYINEIPFTVIVDTTITGTQANAGAVQFQVYQGEYKNIRYDLTNLENKAVVTEFFSVLNTNVQSIVVVDENDARVPYNDISENYFNIFVTTTLGETVEYDITDATFNSLTSTSRSYLVRHFYENMKIHFGDGISGANPSNEATNPVIILEYLKTLGESGNVFTETTNLSFTADFSYTSGVTVATVSDYTLKLISATGGTDEEEVEEIRINAPRLYSTGNRAVKRADYKYILETYSGVKKAIAWGEQEEINNGGTDSKGARNKARYIVLADDFGNINDVNTVIIGVGDGSTLTFNGTLAQLPIPKSVSVSFDLGTSSIETATDRYGDGDLYDTSSSIVGSVSYTTGAITITLPSAPLINTNVSVTYTDYDKTDLIDIFLNDFKTITVTPEYVDPHAEGYIHTIDLTINIAVSEGFLLSSLSPTIQSTITSTFDDDYFDFGEKFFKSDITKELAEIEGVDGISVDWVIDDVVYSGVVWDPNSVALNYIRPFAQIAKIGTITVQALT